MIIDKICIVANCIKTPWKGNLVCDTHRKRKYKYGCYELPSKPILKEGIVKICIKHGDLTLNEVGQTLRNKTKIDFYCKQCRNESKVFKRYLKRQERTRPKREFIGPPHITLICKVHGNLDRENLGITVRKLKTDIGYKPRCKLCTRINQNKRTFSEIKNKTLKQKYNLSFDEYLNLLNEQNNTCAICLKEPSSENRWSRVRDKSNKMQSLHVDHCHNTGKVRGLLCGKCNRGLGLFYDSIENIKRMETYLEKHLQ